MSKTTQDAQTLVLRHVAIIMDGNNRWAKKRFLPGAAGHKAGIDAVRAVVEVCAEAGVEVLTLFAFSSENWQRPASEVGALMELFLMALRRESKRLDQNGIRLRIIGDRSRFHPELQAAMQEAEQRTAHHSKFLLCGSQLRWTVGYCAGCPAACSLCASGAAATGRYYCRAPAAVLKYRATAAAGFVYSNRW